MNFSDFNCPQYVNFLEEHFEDSLECSSNGTCTPSVDIEEENSQNCDKIEYLSVTECSSNISRSVILNNENGRNNQNSAANDHVKTSSTSHSLNDKNKQEYVPLAQQVIAFQQKCPDRYLSSSSKGFQFTKHWSPPKYAPKSPKLEAAKRSREIKLVPEEVKRCEFHARPLNPKIFEKPVLPKPQKQTTQPKSFNLKTAQRAEVHGKKDASDDASKHEFHARPAPKSVFVKPPEPVKVKIAPTKPKSPNFALKSREKEWSKHSEKRNDDIKHPSCKPVQKSVPSEPKIIKQEKKPTQILPFSFEEREKARIALKQQKQEKENVQPVFKAQMLPSFYSSIPTIKINGVNESVLVENKALNQTKFENTVIEKRFKAQPATVLKIQPFVPQKVQSYTEPKEFCFKTDKRAEEWKQLEELKRIEELEKNKALEHLKASKEQQEQLEIMRLRQEAVHKANPIRHYKNVEIKHSIIVTEPETPKFETEKRIQLRKEKTGVL